MTLEMLRGKWSWLFFWGCMDLLALVCYAVSSALQERIPVVDDLLAALGRDQTHNDLFAALVGMAGAALMISMAFSAYLLITRQRSARWLVLAQAPFRLALMMLSFVISLMAGKFIHWPAALISLVILSEVIKLWSIRRCTGSRGG